MQTATAISRPDLLDKQLGMLGELAEVGLEVARSLEREAKSESRTLSPADIALAYARVSRAVRLCIALQTKLIEDFRALELNIERDRSLAALRAQFAPPPPPAPSPGAQAARVLERVISEQAENREVGERLCREATERLRAEDFDLDRPFTEIVADICRDLGLEPDWAGGPLAQIRSTSSSENAQHLSEDPAAPGVPLAGFSGSPWSLSSGRPLAEPGGRPENDDPWPNSS